MSSKINPQQNKKERICQNNLNNNRQAENYHKEIRNKDITFREPNDYQWARFYNSYNSRQSNIIKVVISPK